MNREMMLGMRRRLLATAAGRRGSKAAAAAVKDEAAAEVAADPLRHFRAFRSMDEYVGVTLVKYDNQRDDSAHGDTTKEDDHQAAGDDKQHGDQ
jgi:hypothetical protein